MPGSGQLRPGPLERGEGGGDPVPGDAAEVLHQPAAVVVPDEVEADRVDPPLPEHPDARGPGREVEHRHEHCAPAQPVVLPLRCPEHEDDVLAVAVVLVGDHHVRRQHAVVDVGVAHPGADATLHVHLGAVGGQQPDQGRQEVAPFAGLTMHPWDPDGQPRSGHHRHLFSPGPRGQRARDVTRTIATRLPHDRAVLPLTAGGSKQPGARGAMLFS